MHVQAPLPMREQAVIVCDGRTDAAGAQGAMTMQGVTPASDSTRRRPVWTFVEADYRFGVGDLRMTVDHVEWATPVQQDGETWYEVSGVEVAADGRVVGPRRTVVRASRLTTLRHAT
jgi:hypothetical protein